MKNKRAEKTYVIRVYVYDKVNNETETGFLSFDYGWWNTAKLTDAHIVKTRKDAVEIIKEIINEEPASMSDGKKYPPFEIYRIGEFGAGRTSISFRLSVVEINIDNIEMKELDYWNGTVSYENPEILLTEVGKID
jgi:hypothetical protein